MYTIPPAATGSSGTIHICAAIKATNAKALLSATLIFFACRSRKNGITVNRHSVRMLSFRKTDTPVTARINNFVLGSGDIYTIPAFSKCFFSSFLPIMPPITAQTTVPKIIAGIAHRLAPIE